MTYIPYEIGDSVQKVAVPSYFYATWFNPDPAGPYYVSNPDGEWERMQAAAPAVKYVILNPASGPGDAKSTDWATQIRRAQAAGLHVLGYVTTSYGAKSRAAVVAEIDRYINWYKIDGVFFDEVSSEKAKQPHYASLFNASRNRALPMYPIVINPGVDPDESYMQACDIVANFEGSQADYVARIPTQWEINYPSNRFWHIVYGVTHVDDVLTLTRRRRAGLIYLTPDVLGEDYNPYNTLPPEDFWDTVLTHVRQS